jgi:hypothetical protein
MALSVLSYISLYLHYVRDFLFLEGSSELLGEKWTDGESLIKRKGGRKLIRAISNWNWHLIKVGLFPARWKSWTRCWRPCVFYPQTRTALSQEDVAMPKPLSATLRPVIRFSCPWRFPVSRWRIDGVLAVVQIIWLNIKLRNTIMLSFEEIPQVNRRVIRSG